MIALACPQCRAEYKVPDEFAGRTSACRKCGAAMAIPAPAAPIEPGDWPDTGGPVAVQAYRRQATKSRRGLWIGLALATLLLAAGGGAAYWYFSPTAQLGSDARYLPSNTRFLAIVRVDQLRGRGAWQELEDELPGVKRALDDLGRTGLSRDDIDQLMIGWTMAGLEQPLVIVRAKHDIAVADIRLHEEFATFTEKQVGNLTMYEGAVLGPQRGAPAFSVPESRVLLLGGGDVLRAVLERDGKPMFMADMEDRIKETDFSRPVAFAMNLKGLRLRGMYSGMRVDVQDVAWSMEGVTGTLDDAGQVRIAFVAETIPLAEQLRKGIGAKFSDIHRRDSTTKLSNALDTVQLTTDENQVIATGPAPAAAVVLRAFGIFAR